MKKIVKALGLSAGASMGERTKKSELLDLIKKLRPMDCGKELIRIGGDRDGGYLVPDDLEGIEYCFSPGVSSTIDFENHLAALNIKSFLADYSVDGPPFDRAEFTFDKKFLGANNSDKFFTLQFWRDKHLAKYSGDLLLQMDIESSEFQVILSTPDTVLNDFRIMVIEFHHLDRLFDRFAFRYLLKPCFEKLLTNFCVAHMHPNNCCGSVRAAGIEIPTVSEFTFYNRKRIAGLKERQDFPHVLDRDNVSTKKSLYLPKIWYSAVKNDR